MSIANTIGRTIGAAGAYTVHAAKSSVTATGTFGRDVAAGAQAGYSEHSARLAAQRAAAAALAFTPPTIKVRRTTAKA